MLPQHRPAIPGMINASVPEEHSISAKMHHEIQGQVTPHAQERVAPPAQQQAAPQAQEPSVDISLGTHTTKETSQKTAKRAGKKSGKLWRVGVIIFAVLLIGLTGYVAVDTLMTNAKVKQTIPQTTQNGTGDAASGTVAHTVENEGRDEQEVETSAIDSYAVAPDLPRVLTIKKLNLKARVLPLSVNTDGSLQAPLNIYDSGWYTGSAKPGAVGATFIDAHASGPTREGLFAYLDTLNKGDELSVELGDGKVLTYRVVHTESVPLEGIDMKKVLLPYGTTQRGLNLMTCTGTWVADKKTYDHRAVVYTEQVL